MPAPPSRSAVQCALQDQHADAERQHQEDHHRQQNDRVQEAVPDRGGRTGAFGAGIPTLMPSRGAHRIGLGSPGLTGDVGRSRAG